MVSHLGVLWENGLLLEDDVEGEAGVVVRAAFVLLALPLHRYWNEFHLFKYDEPLIISKQKLKDLQSYQTTEALF